MKDLIRALCLGSAMMLFVSSVSQSVALKWSFSESTHGNIVERTSGGVTTTFDYDLVGQLIEESRTGYLATYSYDANGNRLTRTVNSVTEDYEYDSADKLLSVSIDELNVKQFGYDAAGRTTSVTTSAGTTTLSWDYEDRLTGITYPSTATNSFSYNAFGARVSKTDSSGSFTFARAGASSGSAILSDGSAAYTPGISERRSSVSRFYHFGGQGENGRETASNESTASSRTWHAWGNPLSATGSTNSPFGAFGGSGSETEGDSSLIYSGEGAYYDPSIGRFIVSVSRSSPGGGYASFGDGGLNNPVSASGGPIDAPLVPAADGGGYVVGPSPRREYYGMLSGRLGRYGGSMEGATTHLSGAGVHAAIENPIMPIPAIGAIGKAGKAAFPLVAKLAGKVRQARSQAAFRRALANEVPRVAGADAHHVFARNFAPIFEKCSIPWNDGAKYGAWWERSGHRRNAWAYNKRWSDFLKDPANQSRDKIIQGGREIMREFGQTPRF